MTTEEYGNAYQRGFSATVRFLVSRGLAYDAALDTAQSAWTKGWERRAQLRDPNLILTWTNSIALNIHRTYLRREPTMQALPEMTIPPRITSAVIDAKRILNACRPNDRAVLEGYYIEGYKVQEIAEYHRRLSRRSSGIFVTTSTRSTPKASGRSMCWKHRNKSPALRSSGPRWFSLHYL